MKPDIITIKVTAEHIARGLRGNAGRCPIALAATERLGQTCLVGLKYITCDEQVYRLPKEAQWFVITFDRRRGEVRPFEFSAQYVEKSTLEDY